MLAWSVASFVRCSIYRSVCLPVCLSVCLSVRLPIYSSIYSSVHPSIRTGRQAGRLASEHPSFCRLLACLLARLPAWLIGRKEGRTYTHTHTHESFACPLYSVENATGTLGPTSKATAFVATTDGIAHGRGRRAAPCSISTHLGKLLSNLIEKNKSFGTVLDNSI